MHKLARLYLDALTLEAFEKLAQTQEKKKKKFSVGYGALAGALAGSAGVGRASLMKWMAQDQEIMQLMKNVGGAEGLKTFHGFRRGATAAAAPAAIAAALRQGFADDKFSWKRLLLEPFVAGLVGGGVGALLHRKSPALAGFFTQLGSLYGGAVGTTELVRGIRQLITRSKKKKE